MFRLALTRVCSPAKPLPLLGLRFPLRRSMGRKRGGPQDPLRLSYAQVPQSDGADTCTVLKDELGTLLVMGTEPRGIPWTRGSGCACRPRPCTCWTRTGEQAGLCSPEQTPGARGHAGPAGGPRLALFRPLQDGVYGAGAVNTTAVLRPRCPSPQWPRPSARSKFCIRPKQVPLLAERSPRPPVPLFSAGHPTEASEGQRRTRLTPSSRCGRAEEGASRRGGRDSWGKARSPGSHRSRHGARGLNRGLPASSVRVPGSRRNYSALRFWRREVRNQGVRRGSPGRGLLPLPAPGTPACLGLWPHRSGLCLGLRVVASSVCVSSSAPYRDTCHWTEWGPASQDFSLHQQGLYLQIRSHSFTGLGVGTRTRQPPHSPSLHSCWNPPRGRGTACRVRERLPRAGRGPGQQAAAPSAPRAAAGLQHSPR